MSTVFSGRWGSPIVWILTSDANRSDRCCNPQLNWKNGSSLESYCCHGRLRFGIAHKCVPHEAGSIVLRHKGRNSKVNSQRVAIVPARQWIEGIDRKSTRLNSSHLG